MKKIVLLSDTHGHFDPKLPKYLEGADQIWHAGDIGDLSVTDELRKFAPVAAVYGNIDNHVVRAEFPLNLRFKVDEVRIWMTHIGGKPYVYNKVTREAIHRNPPDIFVCGHSHILLVQYDKRINTLCLNPGACGIKGFHKKKTLLRFKIEGKRIFDMEAIELGDRAPNKE
jgi:putative phosphoesterase